MKTSNHVRNGVVWLKRRPFRGVSGHKIPSHGVTFGNTESSGFTFECRDLSLRVDGQIFVRLEAAKLHWGHYTDFRFRQPFLRKNRISKAFENIIRIDFE
jgi:hypothetical protein